ncbi:MAG: riboflavin synthase [Bdellovibrionales bacterium]|nr:riboflavin synthase [Bdellovibrionales bacterium]
MFTGIIQKVATVKDIVKTSESSLDLVLDNPYASVASSDPIEMGESIATSGVCLTVTRFSASEIRFNVSPETVARTGMARLKKGSKVNLERSLRMGDRLSGHWVQGHVDGAAKLVEVTEVTQGYYDVTIEIQDQELLRYCVKKGSISVEGISLTIHDLSANRLKFQIIPHTWAETDLSDLKNGDLVNIEVDLVAKYIERFQTIKV